MRPMRNAFLALFLLGCASQPLTPAQEVYQLQLQFDAILAEVEAYAAQPPCSETVIVGCYNPDALAKIVEAFGEADRALDNAVVMVQTNGDVRTVTFYADLARAALARAARELAKESAP